MAKRGQTPAVSEWSLVLTVTERVRDLLVRAREGGVVLDYALLDHGADDTAPESVHREAAIMAVGVWSPLRGVRVVDVDPERVPGQRLTADEFYGPLFKRQERRLLLPAASHVLKHWQDRRKEGWEPPGPRGGGPFSFAGDEDPNHAITIPYEGWVWGYAEAFVSPPHSLQLPPLEVQDIFLRLNDELLGDPAGDIEAFRWTSHWDPHGPDVWAPYFEWNWWGGCVWTLRTAPSRILAIGASATE
jgi:hypothetical protein